VVDAFPVEVVVVVVAVAMAVAAVLTLPVECPTCSTIYQIYFRGFVGAS
jgi:hypothetical protein